MGDRVLVTMHDDNNRGEYTPFVYLHWHGEGAPALLKEAKPHLRKGNASYSIARFCGHCHTQIDGITGLGLLEAPKLTKELTIEQTLMESKSHGDAGVIVVNVTTWECTPYGGYLAEDGIFNIGDETPIAESSLPAGI